MKLRDLAFVWIAVFAGVSAQPVLERARELSRTERKWSDRTQRMTLRIVDRRGGTRERKIEVYYKKLERDRSKSLLFFTWPPEVKGTGFLQWIDPHSENRQWLYLPELKRVRRIAGASRRESFMGTDFSFEDLAIMTEILDWTERDAKSSVIGEETCAEAQCWVLAFEPQEKQLAYARIRLWLDHNYVMRRFEFDNAAGEPVKRLEATDIRPVGRVPTAFHLVMWNLRTGSYTEVQFDEVQYDTGLDESLFTEHRLEKGV